MATKTAAKAPAKTKAPASPITRAVNKVNPAKVKAGDLMAIVQYVQVTQVRNNGETLFVNDLNSSLKDIRIQGAELVQECLSADQYAEEKKVTMTNLAEVLISSFNRPLTVCFIKTDNTERVLKGRFIATEPLMGRSHVEDLEIDRTQHRLRLVDHRTVQWLIVDGVKYSLK
jgi:hypothetical protein